MKKKKLLKGRDYDGWMIQRGDDIYMTCLYHFKKSATRSLKNLNAAGFCLGGRVVRLKLVEVK